MNADVFERDMREMPDEYWQMNSDLNDIMRDSNPYGGRYSGQDYSMNPQQAQMMGSVWGAANSAGKMINAAYGSGDGRTPRLTDEQIVKGDIYGTPNFKTQENFQMDLPPDIQAEMEKYRAMNAAGTDPNKRAAYQGQYGMQADMNKVLQYIKSVPQNLSESVNNTMKEAMNLVRDARLRFNPNDVVANAQLSNHHISNQAVNQPGAQWYFPEGDQKANTLLAYGANVNPDVMKWANNADALTDELYHPFLANGSFGSSIKPAYQSSGMTWGAGGQSVVQTGDGDYETRLANGLAEGPHTPYTMNPRNNNDPRYFRTPGTGNQRSPNNAPPLNGNPGAVPSRSGLPSGWSSLGSDTRGRGVLPGVVYGDGTLQGFRANYGKSPYMQQRNWY